VNFSCAARAAYPAAAGSGVVSSGVEASGGGLLRPVCAARPSPEQPLTAARLRWCCKEQHCADRSRVCKREPSRCFFAGACARYHFFGEAAAESVEVLLAGVRAAGRRRGGPGGEAAPSSQQQLRTRLLAAGWPEAKLCLV